MIEDGVGRVDLLLKVPASDSSHGRAVMCHEQCHCQDMISHGVFPVLMLVGFAYNAIPTYAPYVPYCRYFWLCSPVSGFNT